MLNAIKMVVWHWSSSIIYVNFRAKTKTTHLQHSGYCAVRFKVMQNLLHRLPFIFHIMSLLSYKPSSSLFALKIYLRHPSVESFHSGAPPPKKNPGSAPDKERTPRISKINIKGITCLDIEKKKQKNKKQKQSKKKKKTIV